MTIVTYHFPSDTDMKSYLVEHNLLTNPYYMENGITRAIVGLAVKYFANVHCSKPEMQRRVSEIMRDLLNGAPEVGNETLKRIKRSTGMHLADIRLDIEVALEDCANRTRIVRRSDESKLP